MGLDWLETVSPHFFRTFSSLNGRFAAVRKCVPEWKIIILKFEGFRELLLMAITSLSQKLTPLVIAEIFNVAVKIIFLPFYP